MDLVFLFNKYFTTIDDDVELDVLLVTLFGLIAQVVREIGFLKLRRQFKRRMVIDRTYSFRSKVSGQIEKFYFLVGHHDETCKQSGYPISKHFNLVLNTLLKLYNVLLVTPEHVPEDSNDYRWKYFKGCHGSLDNTYIPVRVPHPDIPQYRNHKGNVSVNVLVVCDQQINFIFVLSGWEGSAADSRVLRDDCHSSEWFKSSKW
ncbi:hypothetical protein ACS0TY_026911 [Phlomoides rotata]